MKAQNFNAPNNRSLTEEAERISTIESEDNARESLNNKKGKIIF